MAKMDIEKLLFGDENDVDCEYGNFKVKFEMEGPSGYDDLDMLRAVELIESQKINNTTTTALERTAAEVNTFYWCRL